jgi:hypothetical protein
VAGLVGLVTLVLPTVTGLAAVVPALVPPLASLGLLEVATPVGCAAAGTEESLPPQAARQSRRTALKVALESINRIQPVHINDVASLAAAL